MSPRVRFGDEAPNPPMGIYQMNLMCIRPLNAQCLFAVGFHVQLKFGEVAGLQAMFWRAEPRP